MRHYPTESAAIAPLHHHRHPLRHPRGDHGPVRHRLLWISAAGGRWRNAPVPDEGLRVPPRHVPHHGRGPAATSCAGRSTSCSATRRPTTRVCCSV